MTFGDWSKTIDMHEAQAREDAKILPTILDAIDEGGLSIRETLRYLRAVIRHLTPTPHASILKVFDALRDVLDGTALPFVPRADLFTTPPRGDSTRKQSTALARELANAMLGIIAAAAGTKMVAWSVHGLYLHGPRVQFPYPSYVPRITYIRELVLETNRLVTKKHARFNMWDALFDAFELQDTDRAAAQAAALAGAWPTVYLILRNPLRPRAQASAISLSVTLTPDVN